ncbi:MAG: Uma2 family endonuclease [Pyrinomonadaceae bacterium]
MSEKNLFQKDKNYTTEEYLKMERRSANKHEFLDGKILATAGSNRTHNLIGTNTVIAIGSRSRGQKCEIYSSDMCVRLSDKQFCYPDAVLVASDPSFTDRDCDVLLNPTIVVEIFSNGAQFQDKRDKLESYLAMDSIRECLLVKEDEMRVEHYAKQNAKQWIYKIYNDREDIITLDSINCKISLAEIYAQIRFNQAEVKSQSVN